MQRSRLKNNNLNLVLFCCISFFITCISLANAGVILKSTQKISLHSFFYRQSFENGEPSIKWIGNGTYIVNNKGISQERSSAGHNSFKIDITFGTATSVYCYFPLKIPSFGELMFSGDIYLSKTMDASVTLSAMLELFPSSYSGHVTQVKPIEISSKWVKQDLDIVLQGEKNAGELLKQNCFESTVDDVGKWINGIGLQLKGQKGSRLILYADNLTISGKIPDITEYKVFSKEVWNSYKNRNRDSLRLIQKISEKYPLAIDEKRLTTALKRGYLTPEEYGYIHQYPLYETEETTARIWYVRPHGYKYGKDINGKSKENAFHGLNSIKWGKDGVQPGDTVLLCRNEEDPQFFTRTLEIGSSGLIGKEIIITSENEESPECIISEKQLNHPNFPLYNPNEKQQKGNYAIIGKNIKNIKLRNIRIERCYGTHFYNCSNITIDHLIFENNTWPIEIKGGYGNVVKNCRMNKYFLAGIALIGSDPLTTIPASNCIIENNICIGGMNGDGITLHKNSEGIDYDIGAGNKVVTNVCNNNGEEGLDITSGTDIWVEGNETFHNTRSTTIAHSAQDVYFTRNYSHDEPGVLIHPRISEGSHGSVILSYNVIDSNQSALTISSNRKYDIYNNILCSSGTSIKPAVVDIRLDASDINFVNNLIIAKKENGYFLRVAHGTLDEKNIRFMGNCWWKPNDQGLQNSFYDIENKSYSFFRFKQFDKVQGDYFANYGMGETFSHSLESRFNHIKVLSVSKNSLFDSRRQN